MILYNTIPSWATIEFNLLRSIWHKTRRFSRPRRVGKHQFFKLFSTRELEHNSSWECSWMMVTQEVRSCSYQAVTVFKKWKKKQQMFRSYRRSDEGNCLLQLPCINYEDDEGNYLLQLPCISYEDTTGLAPPCHHISIGTLQYAHAMWSSENLISVP